MLEGLGGDVRVAVAIAADPTAHLEERGQALAELVLLGECLFDIGVKRGNFSQECRAVIRERVLDFVGDGEPRIAQHAGLPERGHAGTQKRTVLRTLARRERGIALGQQMRDMVLGVENALALHFRWVRGQHGYDQCVIEKALERFTVDRAGQREALERIGDRAGLRRRAAECVHAPATVVVTVFGDVGQMRKVAEGPHDAYRLLGRERAQLLFERERGAVVVLAAKFDGPLANRFDEFENGIAFLLAHDIAEQAAQVADVLEKRLILVLAAAADGFRGGRRAGRGRGG